MELGETHYHYHFMYSAVLLSSLKKLMVFLSSWDQLNKNAYTSVHGCHMATYARSS